MQGVIFNLLLESLSLFFTQLPCFIGTFCKPETTALTALRLFRLYSFLAGFNIVAQISAQIFNV